MPLTPQEWHSRFISQARWTAQIRSIIYTNIRLDVAMRILEAGCGTGALLAELPQFTCASIFGLDIDPANLALAASYCPTACLTIADAQAIPFPEATFDLTFCHFLLLWVKDPVRVVNEMRRVTRPGGAVLALAEPDYAARIDYPAELACLGTLQRQALLRQGAQPDIGRRLGEIFVQAGLEVVETGLLGGQWRPLPPRTGKPVHSKPDMDSRDESGVWQLAADDGAGYGVRQLAAEDAGEEEQPDAQEAWEEEWKILEHDLHDLISHQELQRLRAIDRAAWLRGERVLFTPTFYAWGKRKCIRYSPTIYLIPT